MTGTQPPPQRVRSCVRSAVKAIEAEGDWDKALRRAGLAARIGRTSGRMAAMDGLMAALDALYAAIQGKDRTGANEAATAALSALQELPASSGAKSAVTEICGRCGRGAGIFIRFRDEDEGDEILCAHCLRSDLVSMTALAALSRTFRLHPVSLGEVLPQGQAS